MGLGWSIPDPDEYEIDGCPRCGTDFIGWSQRWTIAGLPAIRCQECYALVDAKTALTFEGERFKKEEEDDDS